MSTYIPRRAIRLVVVAALMAGMFASSNPVQAQSSGFPSVGSNFQSTGPYSVSTQSDRDHTFFFPTNLGTGGLRHPVILWGNGTGASVGGYETLLRHWASHGFIVAAANTPNAGSGTEMLAGLNKLQSWNNQSSNRFYQRVDVAKVASSGHSQGGVGALASARDPRVTTTFPLEGAFSSAGVSVPILFVAGQRDTIATPASIRRTFNGSSAPAAYLEVAGATHFTPAGNGGYFRAVGAAWARWHLMDDQNARAWFVGPNCGACNNSNISDYARNARFVAAFGSGATTTTAGPTPTTPTTAPPASVCVRASTRSHVSNDRAVTFLSTVYARGSRDNLGRESFFNIVSLQQTGPNEWRQVASC